MADKRDEFTKWWDAEWGNFRGSAIRKLMAREGWDAALRSLSAPSATAATSEFLAPPDDPKVHRRCKCEFSGGGVQSKTCAFHARQRISAAPALAPSAEARMREAAAKVAERENFKVTAKLIRALPLSTDEAPR